MPGPVNNEHVNVCGIVHDWPPEVRHPRVGVNCCDCETSSVGLTGVTAAVVLTGRTRTLCVTGVLGGGNEDVIVTGIILFTNGIGGGTGAAVIVPVTVVTPLASGPLTDTGVKVTVGSVKLRMGAAPNPVPVMVTRVLSPELIVGGGDVGNGGGEKTIGKKAHCAPTSVILPRMEVSMCPPTQALIVVETIPLGGGAVI